MKNSTALKAMRVKLAIFDVDGVMTDGSLIYSESGENLKVLSARDGLGLKLLKQFGIQTAVVSGRASPALRVRLEELGVDHIYTGVVDKLSTYLKLRAKLKLSDEEISVMGDDLPDAKILSLCGLSFVPNDCPSYIKEIADHVTTSPGGRGSVRECCDLLLTWKGHWDEIREEFF